MRNISSKAIDKPDWVISIFWGGVKFKSNLRRRELELYLSLGTVKLMKEAKLEL